MSRPHSPFCIRQLVPLAVAVVAAASSLAQEAALQLADPVVDGAGTGTRSKSRVRAPVVRPPEAVLPVGRDGRPTRAWGPEQATGEPDTPIAGDIQTAWASRTADGQKEWLLLTYETAVTPVKVRIHETYNPGAVTRVTVLGDDNLEVVGWDGTDPVPRNVNKGVAEIPIEADIRTKRVKIYIDSPAVPGWNEIDAVELIGADGTRQWASKATASSTFAERTAPTPVVMPPGPRPPADEFTRLVGHGVAIHVEGDTCLRGEVVANGQRFVVLRQTGTNAVLLVNKERVIYVAVPPRPAEDAEQEDE